MSKLYSKVTFRKASDNKEVTETTFTLPSGHVATSRNIHNPITILNILDKAMELSDYERGFVSGLIDFLPDKGD